MSQNFGEVKFFTLPDMVLASYTATSFCPEDDAIDFMTQWFEDHNISKDSTTRAFGRNVNASVKDGKRSYELMVTVPTDTVGDEQVTIKNLKSDYYAVMRVDEPFEDPLHTLPLGWKILKNWVNTTDYRPKNERSRLFFEEIISDDSGTHIDLFHPILEVKKPPAKKQNTRRRRRRQPRQKQNTSNNAQKGAPRNQRQQNNRQQTQPTQQQFQSQPQPQQQQQTQPAAQSQMPMSGEQTHYVVKRPPGENTGANNAAPQRPKTPEELGITYQPVGGAQDTPSPGMNFFSQQQQQQYMQQQQQQQGYGNAPQNNRGRSSRGGQQPRGYQNQRGNPNRGRPRGNQPQQMQGRRPNPNQQRPHSGMNPTPQPSQYKQRGLMNPYMPQQPYINQQNGMPRSNNRQGQRPMVWDPFIGRKVPR